MTDRDETEPLYDISAEQAVLGSLMIAKDPDVTSAVRGTLTSGDYFRPHHRTLHQVVIAMRDRGEPTDPLSVYAELQRHGLAREGTLDAPYLHTLDATAIPANAVYHARIVREKAQRRHARETLLNAADMAINPSISMDSVRAEVRPVIEPETGDLADDAALLSGVHDGEWLTKQDFPELRYAVPGLIPEGLTLLVGPPKAGKSWMVLDLLLAVASGGMALGHIRIGPARRVLYLALEDGDRRMQDRCRSLLAPGKAIPSDFTYKTRIVPGKILETIRAQMRRHPDTAMVVIDTLGKVMPQSQVGESAYQRDYRVGSALKRLADDHPGLAVVVLHHDRKAISDDFVDSVSGTHGLAGAADTVMALVRKRQAEDGSLFVTGRDVEENEYAIAMRGTTWQLSAGDLAGAAAEARKRTATANLSGKSGEILEMVNSHPEGIQARDVVAEHGKGAYTYLGRLVESGHIRKTERGLYIPASSPSLDAPNADTSAFTCESNTPNASNRDAEADDHRPDSPDTALEVLDVSEGQVSTPSPEPKLPTASGTSRARRTTRTAAGMNGTRAATKHVQNR